MRQLLLALALAAGTALSAAALQAAEPQVARSQAADTPDKAAVTRHAEQLLADTYPADGPGAAVLVARGDEVLYRGARGMADIAAGTPLSADDVFRIGSITKQFAAAGLLTLVEAGKVALSDPLSKYVADYPNGDDITVLQLLNHTSGVKSFTDIPGRMEEPATRDMTTAELVDSFKNEAPDFAPGQDWHYNNSGYALVGAVIEAASGMAWHDYLEQVLFAPLGLDDTGYGVDPELVAEQAHGYTFTDGKPVEAMAISMTQPHAAGALVSSVDDLLKWDRALHEGKVLQTDTYRQMITPVGKASDEKYGFGLVMGTLRGRARISHEGGIHGFSTQLIYLPDSDITVVVLQNSDTAVPGKPGVGVLATRLGAFALGEPFPDASPVAVDAAALQAAEGVYRIDGKSTRVLRVVDDKLTVQRTGGPRSLLVPIGKGEFLYENSLTRIKLLRDADGAVTGMHIYQEGESPPQLTPRTDESLPAERKTITLPHTALERVVGIYASGPMELKIFLDGEQRKAQLSGQPAFEIFAESATRFFLTVVDATLEFAAGNTSPAWVTLHQAGQATEFKRMPD